MFSQRTEADEPFIQQRQGALLPALLAFIAVASVASVVFSLIAAY